MNRVRFISLGSDTPVPATLVPHALALEDPRCDKASDSGQQRRKRPVIEQRHALERQAYIHAIEAEHDVGDSHHDRDNREHLHHDIQIVGDDARKRVHRSRQRVGIDVAHLDCLMDLDEHVFE